MPDWLVTYCGAKDTRLVRKIGQAWLISAVARALQPGCKADCALVLEGKQGQGKSAMLKALACEAWFYDGLPDLHSKDSSAAIKGKWVIGLAEMSAMGKSEIEAMKAFLSRTEERYRPAYGRAEVVEPRRCVLMARYDGKPVLPVDVVCRDYFAPLTLPVFLRKISEGKIPLPLVRMETSQKGARLVHLADLAAYIDERRKDGQAEARKLSG